MLKRFFGQGGNGLIDDALLFMHGVRMHFGKFKPDNAWDAFIAAHLPDKTLEMLGGLAAEKMNLTQADGDEHSIVVCTPTVCYEVSTLRASIPEAQVYFTNHYGGFINALQGTWQSKDFRANKCKVHLYIVYGRVNYSTWVDIALLSMNQVEFSVKGMLPADLMTDEERTEWS